MPFISSRIFKKTFTSVLLFSFIAFTIFSFPLHLTASNDSSTSSIEEPSNLYALSACLLDGDSGRVLYEKDGSAPRAMASTTKIMTLIVSLETVSLDTVVTASALAASQPDVQLNMSEGEQFYLKDLVYSLMLESHNDSAYAIAETVAGSVESFAALMNAKAAEIGCTDTYFITPNGLDASDETSSHHTTAVDLAKIMRYCIMESPMKEKFQEITTTSSYSFSNLAGNKSYSCTNHNALLTMVDGVLSGKTGFTADAGYCYVCAVNNDGRTFIISLLGCGWPNNKTYKWKDTKALLAYGIDNFTRVNLFDYLPKNQSIQISHAQNSNSQIFSSSKTIQISSIQTEYYFLMRKDEQLSWILSLSASTAPIEKDQVVGEYLIYCNQSALCSIPLFSLTNVSRRTYRSFFHYIYRHFLFSIIDCILK